MKNTILFAVLIISFLCFGFQSQQEKRQKTILAVLAHPDDEGAIGPVLAKYAKNNKVYLIIATDGRNGVRDHAGIPAGDSLARIRKTESECACKIMGVQPPIFLGFTDGFDTRNGVGVYLEQSLQLKEMLTKKIKELNPDIIITFGPDGDTGHSDHRMISNMTTEIILKEGWVEKYPLYYLGWTQQDNEKYKKMFGILGGLNIVSPEYLNVSIEFNEEDKQKALKSMECYRSQMTYKELEEMVELEKKDSKNTLYFRQLIVSAQQKTEF
jgi:LmbE family N-acetylglucosaminyl deacetylase